MKIEIKRLDSENKHFYDTFQKLFLIESKLVLDFTQEGFRYTYEKVAPFEKQYDSDVIEISDYIGNPDKIIFLAFIEDKPVGHIRLRRNWNKYGYVEDIVVDRSYRGIGIGGELIKAAKRWITQSGLPGLMLETQDNNISGCKLYEKEEFSLGGYDKFLYRGADPNTDEVALFWYWIAPKEKRDSKCELQ